jgi:hypothetical protein
MTDLSSTLPPQAGYYGDGLSCKKCRICDDNSAISTPCLAGSATDTVECTCNQGYEGDGYGSPSHK